MSITQPEPDSVSPNGSATDRVDVCRPRPISVTSPTARSASGTRRFTNVDLPTPECPSRTVILPASRSATASRGSSTPAAVTVNSRSANCLPNGSAGARSVLVRQRIGVSPPA
ncbi:Uncharacterised protein [Mycobacterium tuberculosis]|nr:Uncharacterised protein [Mycobacterium tuberculosis]